MIYHIAYKLEWEAEPDVYAPGQFNRDGFIHCSDRNQLIKVANSLFNGKHNLVLLGIDPTQLTAKTVYENLEGGERFPHIYGRINKNAVKLAVDFQEGDRGYILPKEILSLTKKGGKRG